MALDYIGVPNGLFKQLGKCGKYHNQYKTDAAGVDTALAEVADSFQAMTLGYPDLMMEGVPTAFNGWKNNYIDRRRTLRSLAEVRLRDQITVLDQIGAVSTNTQEILFKLIRQMGIDAQSVNKSTVTIGATAAGGTNTGNGTVLTTKLLDGVTSPGSNANGSMAANIYYRGLNSELCVASETMRLTVTADSFADSTGEGNESMAWNGRLADVGNGYLAEGSGSIGTIVPANSPNSNLLVNGDFENITLNAPDNWTIVAGAAGTEIVEDLTGANVYHGVKSLKFVGTAAASIEIKQAIAASLLKGSRMYCVTARIKADAAIAAGTLLIQFEGTGYAAGGTEKISIAPGALPVAYTLVNFFVLMPVTIPADLRLVVRWSGTPTTTKQLWIDDMTISPVTYGGGLGIVPVRGSIPFVRNDYFTWTVTNDEAGIFQRMFRQMFGVQLPSNAVPTIADALAT